MAADERSRDFLMSAFVAAALSYRHDTVCRPFPPAFTAPISPGTASRDSPGRVSPPETRPGSEAAPSPSSLSPSPSPWSTPMPATSDGPQTIERDIEGLRGALQTLPADTTGSLRESPEAAALKSWVFRQRHFRLASVDPSMFESIEAKAGKSHHTTRPHFIFEVLYDPEWPGTSNFEALLEKHGGQVAFHGTALENVHSILHTGFLNHMNKTSLYGEGTYLSSDLGVACGFAKFCRSWEKSSLGSALSTILACQVVKHPNVKFEGKVAENPSGSSLSGKVRVPEKYIVVPNNEHVRVKYVLVYAEPNAPPARSWMGRNKFILVCAFYFLVLLLVGLFRTAAFKKWWKKTFAT